MRRSVLSGLAVLLFASLIASAALLGSGPALAQPSSGVPTPAVAPAAEEEKIELNTRYPIIKGKANSSFQFDVELRYTGTAPRVFDLAPKGPPQFLVLVQPQFESKEISAIRIDPARALTETVKLSATPLPWNMPAPGVYGFTLGVSGGTLKSEIEVKAQITPDYSLSTQSASGSSKVEASAGQESRFTFKVKNPGTIVLSNVGFSATAPQGWTIRFSPDKIDSLAASGERDVDAIIQPPAGAEAGDYMLTLDLKDSTGLARTSMDLRTTVLNPSIGGWLGTAIVLIVIAGAVYAFLRFGKR